MDRAAAAAATVSTVVEGTPSDGSDAVTVKIEEEFNTKQQSMLSELAEMSNNIKSKQAITCVYCVADRIHVCLQSVSGPVGGLREE